MFCTNCGAEISDKAAICIKCGVLTGTVAMPGTQTKSRTSYVLLGVFLGGLGIHNFFAGYTNKAVAQLLITLLAGWLVLPLVAVWIWVIVEVCTITKDANGTRFS